MEKKIKNKKGAKKSQELKNASKQFWSKKDYLSSNSSTGLLEDRCN